MVVEDVCWDNSVHVVVVALVFQDKDPHHQLVHSSDTMKVEVDVNSGLQMENRGSMD